MYQIVALNRMYKEKIYRICSCYIRLCEIYCNVTEVTRSLLLMSQLKAFTFHNCYDTMCADSV